VNSSVCVPTISRIATARSSTVVSSSEPRRPLEVPAGSASSRGVIVCQALGSVSSRSASLTETSTYDSESPPRLTNELSSVASGRPSSSA
jgi:hypothetical protein